MAARYFAAESTFPELNDAQSTEEQLQRILDYLYLLNEQYQYILCKLNEEGEQI